MNVLRLKKISGPNIFAYNPVIEMDLDLGKYDQVESKEISFFNQTLLELFPGLKSHHCSLGKAGGFIERLEQGTYFGHIVEHLALEIQASIGHDVYYGKTRWLGNSRYQIVFAYQVKEVGEYAGRIAVEIVEKILNRQQLNQNDYLARVEELDRKYGLGPSTASILRAAEKRGIPYIPLVEKNSLFQLGYGCRQKRIEATISSSTSCIGVDIASDKWMTKQLLNEAGIAVPAGYLAESEEELKKIVLKLEMPVVVKPYNGNQGKGVTLDVYNWAELLRAFYEARKYSRKVIVEEFIPGKDYRLLIINNKLAAAAERIAAQVIGDGVHTIEELIDLTNQEPQRGEGHEKPLTAIKIDSTVKNYLLEQGYNLKSIPEKRQVVKLRKNGNLSTGGISRDVTAQVHPYNRQLAVRAARLIGLDIAGIDLVTPDIRIPVNKSQGAILEVNAAPGIRMHHFPVCGDKQAVAEEMITYLFPENDGRIPIISITGTNGKTTTTRMLAHILSLDYKRVGMTTTSGIFINKQCILPGDNTGPRSARTLLQDPSIEIAVLETARGGIIRDGLGYDQSDIGIITNITEDHLGIQGVETLDDLAEIKSLIIETVSKDGYSVLNADDPTLVKLSRRSSAPVIFFSLRPDNVVVKKHINQGGRVVFLEDNSIICVEGNKREVLVESIADIPITYGGLAGHNVENVLAVVSAAVGLGIKTELINRGLKTFNKNYKDNLGRLNVYTTSDLKVILDYGHNPAGFEKVFSFMKKLGGSRLVGVIGVPGDRKDELIIESGRVAGRYLNKCYIKEDQDLRGRKKGEVAELLLRGVTGVNPEAEYRIIFNEKEALEQALSDACPGDVIVCFYEKDPQQLAQIIRQGIIEYETSSPILSEVQEKI